jgi:hypothetical protein
MLVKVTEWKPLDEGRRRAIVRDILEDHPEHDIANSSSGALLGPASPDRLCLPVWEYLDFVAANPSVPLSTLTAVRFPVLFFEGESDVTSIDEELRPLPSHLKHTPKLTVVLDAEALIRRYIAEHDAGLVEWDPGSRGIRYLVPVTARRPVLKQWFATLSPAD